MASQISRTVSRAITAVEQGEGAGARVRRSIGTPQLRNFHPFLMLDHFRVPRGAGFPDHPHRGQGTVTYMLEGKFQHEDFAGHAGTIGPGDVQWMLAGRGIMHAEMPLHEAGGPDPSGLQLWVDLPAEHKMVPPSYQEFKDEELPRAYPEGKDGGVTVKIISGESHGVSSPVRHLGGCWFFDINLAKKGSRVFQAIPQGWNSFAYSLSGTSFIGAPPSSAGDAREPLPAFHTIVFSNDFSQTGLEIEAGEDDTRIVVIAGEPLDQPVVQYGPFVLTSREEVIQAFEDYELRKNGFENAGWKSKIGGRR